MAGWSRHLSIVLCVRLCLLMLCGCLCVFVDFGGIVYLQLSLWETSKSNRKGRGAWEDLHSVSCVILLC